MKQRTLERLIGLVLVLLICVLLVGSFRGRAPITQASTAQIPVGMSVQEVEQFFGGPAQDVLSNPDPGSKALLYWGGENGVALVWFNARGLVVKTEFCGGSEGRMLSADLSVPVTTDVLNRLFSQPR